VLVLYKNLEFFVFVMFFSFFFKKTGKRKNITFER